MKNLLIAFLILVSFIVKAQTENNNQNLRWDAKWICVPDAGEHSAGLYIFRKTLNLEQLPQKFEIYVSADNRYKLFVNEKLVSLGPALGDINHWNL